MSRPTPRKSSLTGSSPLAPVVETPTVDEVPAAVEAKAPQKRADRAAAKPAASEKRKYPPKVSFYQSPEVTDRVRGAMLHTMAHEGHLSLSEFINGAVLEKVERLEAKYNNGKPFPPLGAHEVPRGRPTGS